MFSIRHLNCGTLKVPPNPPAACHCLLLEGGDGLVLIDTGIGLLDVRDPVGRVGRPAIDAAGFQFDEAQTALRQIERLGFAPGDVRHILLTHADPDHVGGLADFPQAVVHLSVEEHAAVQVGHWRYRPPQFAHGPRWQLHDDVATLNWFGRAARPVEVGLPAPVLIVPLPGHTAGHCGVAVNLTDDLPGGTWLLHVGDAYYLRIELTDHEHPIHQLTAARADDNASRTASLNFLRDLALHHSPRVTMFGYHDFAEFPD